MATSKKAAKKATAKKKAAAAAGRKKAAAKKAAGKTARKKVTTKKSAAGRKTTATHKKTAAAARKKTATTTRKKSATSSRGKASARKTATAAATTSAQPPIHHTVVESIAPYVEQPGEEYMSDAQKEHFYNILMEWKRELMEEVDRTVHHMQDEAANFPDPNDRATQESEFSLELRTRDRERKLIKKIDEALEKLERDEYGYCESCGVEIGIRRLEARPTATLCIECKTLEEIKEKQMGK